VTTRITIVGGKFAVAAVWCVTSGSTPTWSVAVAVAVTGLLRLLPRR